MSFFCTSCGHALGENDRFCGQCGAKVGSATSPDSTPSEAPAPAPHFPQWIAWVITIAALIAGFVFVGGYGLRVGMMPDANWWMN